MESEAGCKALQSAEALAAIEPAAGCETLPAAGAATGPEALLAAALGCAGGRALRACPGGGAAE